MSFKAPLQVPPPKHSLFKHMCKGQQVDLYLSKSLPFIYNRRGVLVHRPKKISLSKVRNEQWQMSVDYLCNGHAHGTNIFTLIQTPPEDSVVCQHCEREALSLGMLSSSAIATRHVCIGGVRTYKVCCT